MKKAFLLTEIGTNVIFDTVFSTRELAEEQIAKSNNPEYWEIIELKYI
jgi:hypothetical protein